MSTPPSSPGTAAPTAAPLDELLRRVAIEVRDEAICSVASVHPIEGDLNRVLGELDVDAIIARVKRESEPAEGLEEIAVAASMQIEGRDMPHEFEGVHAAPHGFWRCKRCDRLRDYHYKRQGEVAKLLKLLPASEQPAESAPTRATARIAFERWMLEDEKWIVGGRDLYARSGEESRWRCWLAAWNAARP